MGHVERSGHAEREREDSHGEFHRQKADTQSSLLESEKGASVTKGGNSIMAGRRAAVLWRGTAGGVRRPFSAVGGGVQAQLRRSTLSARLEVATGRTGPWQAFSTKVSDPIPINFKKGKEDPVIKADEEYPDWLWNLEPPSLAELTKKGMENLSPEESRLYWQKMSKKKIKDNNAASA